MVFSIKNFSFDMDFEKRAMREISSALERGGRVGVACSGGADSVLALLAVADIFGAQRGGIKVLHFDHKARASSGADAQFVRSLARTLGLEAFFGAPETPPLKKTEDEFRRLRYDFFREICARENIALIVQGHHANDAAETALMRLCRGGGSEGLCAPAAVSEVGGSKFARPLLNISKRDIVSALETAGVEWREDETNNCECHFRNKIRLRAIPQMLECSPNFLAGVRRSQTLLGEDLEAVNAAFNKLFEPLNPEVSQSARLCGEILACRAYLRRAAMRLLAANGLLGCVRARAVDSFLDAVSAAGSAPVKTPVGGFFMVFEPRRKTLSLASAAGCENFEIEAGFGECLLPGGRSLSIKKVSLGAAQMAAIKGGDSDDSKRAYLDISCLGGGGNRALTVRSRREGDAYAPIGRASPKKLKDLFNAKKVPILKRKSAFVVCNNNGEILWVPSLAPAEKFKIANSPEAIELTLSE